MERLTVFPLDVLDQLSDAPEKRKDNVYLPFRGEKIKLTSQRYAVFKKSSACCECGAQGEYFAAERSMKEGPYHLNLYAIRPDGSELLMTKDHIVPKCKGGLDIVDNYQTMCIDCNSKKGGK